MDILYTIQRSLFTVYNFLPIIFMLTLLTFGFGLGNYGMITIFLGQFAISVITFFARGLLGTMDGNNVKKSTFSLFPSDGSVQFPSIWIANMSFLFGVLMLNAYSVYNIDATKNAGSDPNMIAQIDTPIFQSKVSNRKTRCIMIITTCAILALLLLGYRVFSVEGGNLISLTLSILVLVLGGAAAWLWNKIITQPNLGLGLGNMDIFGISQQLISVKQTDVKTMCELKPAATQ